MQMLNAWIAGLLNRIPGYRDLKLRYKVFLATGIAAVGTIIMAMTINTVFFYNQAVEFRNREIKSSFSFYLNEINHSLKRTEETGFDVARAGVLIYELRKKGAVVTEATFEEYLVPRIRNNSEILGGGIWYQPFAVGPKYMGPYAFWEGKNVKMTWEYNTPTYDYPAQAWYTLAIPQDWTTTKPREKPAYRTLPYLDKLEGVPTIFMTVSTIMYSDLGEIIGVSTVDWTFGSTRKLLERFKITDHSYAVLLHLESGKIIYHPKEELTMQDTKSLPWAGQISKELKPGEIYEINNVSLDGRKFNVYYQAAEAGFLFVSLVDVAEAYTIMGGLILRNALITVLTLVFLALFIFIAIDTTISPLHQIIGVLRGIASGSKSLGERIPVTSSDEFGQLATHYNAMSETIERQTTEIKQYNEHLEQMVTDRTRELEETLRRVQELKVQQDGDYFLTTLLTDPLFKNRNRSDVVKIDFLLEQYKKFNFKAHSSHLGGDLCVTGNLIFSGVRHTMFFNGDAMGKSMQGAGGALVMGSLINAIMARSAANGRALEIPADQWLKETHSEIQRVFETFDGSMFVSCVMGIINDQTGMLYYFNAEHPFSLICRKSAGTVEYVENHQHVYKIGVPGQRLSTVASIQLEPGDVLIAGSDGRQDLVVAHVDGVRTFEEDDNFFRGIVAETGPDLKLIVEALRTRGAVSDDLSLLRVSYKESLNAQPVEPSPLEQAISLIRQRNYSSALLKLQALPEQGSIMVNYYKSLCLARMGDLPGAASLLHQIDHSLQENEAPLRLLGSIYAQMGNFAEARKYYERVLTINPTDEKARKALDAMKGK